MEKIQEQIDTFIKLQEIDAEIYNLREEKAAKPAEKQTLEKAFIQRNQDLKVKDDSLKSLQLKRKECEMDLEVKEKDVKKYQTQLFQIKTNKEYMSLQKEIKGLKADNAVLEDDILKLLERIDEVKAEIAEEKAGLALEEKRFKEETEKIDQEIKSIEAKMSCLEKARNQLCANIDKGMLTQYERILKAKGGIAFVPIVGESCGGCHRILPPQMINEARMKDRIITCEFCARLLYWPEQENRLRQ